MPQPRKNRLLQLLADNRQRARPMAERIRAAGREATVYLYDPIVGDRWEAEYWGGVCPQDFVPALHALDVDVIHLRINSPGGDVFAAEAMAQALREHPADVVGHVDGLAASAATNIACACSSVEMSIGAQYMIHKAWSITLGNADDLREFAGLLDQVDAGLVDIYARRTGAEPAKITDWMAAETWFSAQQAIDAGFVDRLASTGASDEKSARAAASAPRWNLAAYDRAPQRDDLEARIAAAVERSTAPLRDLLAGLTPPAAAAATPSPATPAADGELARRHRLAQRVQVALVPPTR